MRDRPNPDAKYSRDRAADHSISSETNRSRNPAVGPGHDQPSVSLTARSRMIRAATTAGGNTSAGFSDVAA